MKKGISAVIAVIMLLMITVALIGMAYVWVSSAFSQVTETTGESLKKGTETMATRFVIVSAWNGTESTREINISLQNTGEANIQLDQLSYLLKGIDLGAGNVYYESKTPDGVLEPGEKAKIYVSANGIYSCNEVLTVKYGAIESSHEVTCS